MAGTRVYDEKREESRGALQEAGMYVHMICIWGLLGGVGPVCVWVWVGGVEP